MPSAAENARLEPLMHRVRDAEYGFKWDHSRNDATNRANRFAHIKGRIALDGGAAPSPSDLEAAVSLADRVVGEAWDIYFKYLPSHAESAAALERKVPGLTKEYYVSLLAWCEANQK